MKKTFIVLLIILALAIIAWFLPVLPTKRRVNVFQCFLPPCDGAWQERIVFDSGKNIMQEYKNEKTYNNNLSYFPGVYISALNPEAKLVLYDSSNKMKIEYTENGKVIGEGDWDIEDRPDRSNSNLRMTLYFSTPDNPNKRANGPYFLDAMVDGKYKIITINSNPTAEGIQKLLEEAGEYVKMEPDQIPIGSKFIRQND